MKLAKHSNTLETNVQGEAQSFAIGDMSIVMDILRKRIYRNPIQTLVQEYISNARDAMREIGKGNAFEITVPTALNPVFKVRDFGPGISPNRMKNVFILYGASTKRDSNTQTGGFGIGAKSAWAYTDAFTITTIVDGVKRFYTAHTGVDNNGRLDLTDTQETTAPNGTEIQVAVKRADVDSFADAVLRAIYFWEEKPTLKGMLEVPTLVKGLKVGTNLEVIKSELLPHYIRDTRSDAYAIIDGIPYPIESNLLVLPTLYKLTEFIRHTPLFHIDNGVLDVSASRESITDSPKSKDAFEKLASKTFLEVKTHIASQFKKATEVSEYIDTYQTLNGSFNVEKGFADHKEYRIDIEYLKSELFKKVTITEVHCMGKYGRGRVEKLTKEMQAIDKKRIPLRNLGDLFFVDTNESLIAQNKRIRTYFENDKNRLFIIQPLVNFSAEFKQVVSDLKVRDFQDITYTVVPKEERVKIVREKTKFCVHPTRGGCIYPTLADNTQKWLFVPITKSGWEMPLNDLRELNEYIGDEYDLQICGLAERALKMVEGDKNFSPLKDWLDKFKPSKKELNYAKMLKGKNSDWVTTLSLIKGIDDPELVDIVKEYKELEHNISVFPSTLLKKVNEEKAVKDFVAQDEAVTKLLRKTYPLFVSAGGRYGDKKEAQEFVFYLNVKYKESK